MQLFCAIQLVADEHMIYADLSTSGQLSAGADRKHLLGGIFCVLIGATVAVCRGGLIEALLLGTAQSAGVASPYSGWSPQWCLRWSPQARIRWYDAVQISFAVTMGLLQILFVADLLEGYNQGIAPAADCATNSELADLTCGRAYAYYSTYSFATFGHMYWSTAALSYTILVVLSHCSALRIPAACAWVLTIWLAALHWCFSLGEVAVVEGLGMLTSETALVLGTFISHHVVETSRRREYILFGQRECVRTDRADYYIVGLLQHAGTGHQVAKAMDASTGQYQALCS